LFIEDALTRTVSGPAPVANYILPLGKANVEREGTDVSFISYGRPLQDMRKMVDRLAEEGISVEIVDLRTVSPLDTDTIIKSVNKTGRAVIAHEAVRSFGVGAEVTARIQEHCFNALKAPVLRVASKDVAVPFARKLEQEFLYKATDIEAAIRQTLEGSTTR
jgi:pyruvate dehydrogenase E1 component beta subunit